MNQLLIFLRLCATGSHLSCIGDFGGVHLSTVPRITKRVGRALAGLNRRFIRMPETAEEINKTQLEFYEKARFPRVIGAVDGTHIKIQSPEVVVATAVLQNICNEEDPPDPEDLELFLRIMEKDEVPHIPPHVRENDAAIAFQTQRVLIDDYFSHLQ
ncbi:hypothetical protein JTB14_024549 [Gonioctena quinquepunctata]|nr:hypothetical protein JTB14_024549 [Gonioctena quinquepunctata]